MQALKKMELTQLAAASKPPPAITRILAALCLMLGEEPLTWATAQRVLTDRRLAQRLMRWDVNAFAQSSAADRLATILCGAAAGSDEENGPSTLVEMKQEAAAYSGAASALFAWVSAMQALLEACRDGDEAGDDGNDNGGSASESEAG